MKTIGNIVWLICGGLMIAIGYFLTGLSLMVTIIGIPFGIQCIKLGVFSLCPFGHHFENSNKTQSVGCLNVAMNIIWVITGGFIISLSHLFWGIMLCITIIGIPFGKQHFKMIPLALLPFGKTLV